jgi:hypothetical protein
MTRIKKGFYNIEPNALKRQAIAKEPRRVFLDKEKKLPLHFDTNAMRYGSLEFAKYYDAEHLFQ